MATFKDQEQRDFRLISKTQDQQKSQDFNLMKVGKGVLQNDVIKLLPALEAKETRTPRVKRKDVVRAIDQQNLKDLRIYSEIFFNSNGIYSRLCRYMAYLYRYDWFITPIVFDSKIKKEKIIEGWYKSSVLLENSRLKRLFGEIALKVIKYGCYYGYKLEQKTMGMLQELPPDYCRSRYKLNGRYAVEFNIKFFDDTFSDVDYRLRVLKMFPKEFQKAYIAYKNGTLPKDFNGDTSGWFLLDPEKTVKFNLSDSDAPLFISVIPALMDLDDAQDMDKEKMRQQILKIIIQQMPIDKNGDLVFDTVEAQALHNNAVAMLASAVGVDVLTTFADVTVADMSDKGNVSSVDQLDKVERTVYNEAGVSQMQFNTSGNLALEKSIANDEATMSNLIDQFEDYAEKLLKPFNKNPKRLLYKVQILPTTIYNYKELSSLYKEQTMLGFSKLLPQVALGQTQSSIIATAYFENELMDLDSLFVPPQMSSTMSGKETEKEDNSNVEPSSEDDKGGRPTTPDDEKAEKTIQNIESGG